MRVIILAAGQGTRLRPLTDAIPKCMVELCGKPLLRRQLERFAQVGIDDVTVVGGYAAHALPDDVRVIRNLDFETTNMVASLFCARELLDDRDDLIVCYGDIVFEPRVLLELCAASSAVTLPIDRAWRSYWSMRMPDPLDDAETLRLDPDGHVIELGKKPRSYDQIEGQYIGMFKIAAARVPELCTVYDAMDRAARYDGQSFDNMYMTSFLTHLIDVGWKIQSMPMDHGWLEVDSVEDLSLYERLHAEGELDELCKLD